MRVIKKKTLHEEIADNLREMIMSGELEEELPGWEIQVGPREAVDIPAYLKSSPG